MATSYTYRLLKDASWGIVITLGGDLLPGAILPPHALKISEAVWLDIDVGWRPSEEEVGFLKLGVNLVADEIERTCEGKLPIVVRVTGLQYTPSDYQPEGLAAAIAEWIAQQCGVPKPEIPVAFDRAHHRYIFNFSGARTDGVRASSSASGSTADGASGTSAASQRSGNIGGGNSVP